MNVNNILMGLKDVTGLPVAPDVYTGTAKKWITFTYEDERPAISADDEVKGDTAYIQVQLYTPVEFDYLTLKAQIKEYLESIEDAVVPSVRSFVTIYTSSEKKVRQTVFSVEITRWR